VHKSKGEQTSPPNQLLVLHAEEPPTKRKRIEVSDLLNPPEVIKVEKVKLKTKTKKPNRPPLMLHDVSEKLLDCVVNLTWKDLMTVQPRLITPLVKQMRSTSRKKKLQLLGKYSDDELTDEQTDEEMSGDDTSESSTDEAEFEDPLVQDVVQKGELPARYTELKPASYLKVRIGKNECGLFLDTGAHYSIVSQAFLGKIGAVPTLLEHSKKICPIDKSSLIIRKCCTMNIEFAPGVVIPITFLVMDNAAVPLLLGIIDFMHIEGSISYSNSEVTIRLKSKQVTLPLYEKRELDEVLSEEDDNDEIIASVLKEFVSDNAEKNDDVGLSHQEMSDIEYQEIKLQKIKDRITEIATLDDNERKKVRELLIRYEDIFEDRIECLPGLKDYYYEILLEPDAKPIASKCRRFSPKEKVIIREELTKMKQAGIVKESKSEWVSPVVLVPKPDGSIRFCINFKALNKVTPKDKYPLPLIDDCVQQLSGKPFVSLFDCASGYWQVKLHPTSTKYTAFITPFGTYEFTVLPFGLTNAPALFSRLMEKIFEDFRGQFMAIYLDDLAVFSSSFEEHLDHLEQVFKRLREHQVMLKLKKCQFVAQGFRYLGFMITPQGLQPDPSKVDALVKLKVPKNVHQLRSFLGLAGYFRRFINVFAEKAVPLTALLRKDAEFIWTSECDAAVAYFKNALVTAPVLKQVDEKNALVLSCDASGTALGSVLEQFDEEGVLRPVAYYSRRFLKAECNYISYERECLAVVSSIQHFRYLLHGRFFTVYTDNSAVTAIFRARDPVGRIARWIYILSEYDFDLKHRAGKENHVADALSRLPVVAVAVEEDQSPGPITFDAVEKYLTGDNNLDSPRMRREARNYVIDSSGSLFRRTKLGNVKVLRSIGEVHDVLRVLHDQLGHFGFNSVWDWVRERFWAKSLYRDVKQFISSCVECQSYSFRRPLYQFTGQSKISGILTSWYLDCVGPFNRSPVGNAYLLVMVEPLSGYPLAFPIPVESTSAVLPHVESVFATFGNPSVLVADRGPAFRSTAFKNMCATHGVTVELIPSYQPEWAGMVERVNLSLRYALYKMVGNSNAWETVLQSVLYGLRVRRHSRTGVSPYFMMFGVSPRLSIDDPELLPLSPDARKLELALVDKVRTVNRREKISGSKVITFTVGSLVLVLRAEKRKGKPLAKSQPIYVGPCKVLNVLEHNLYRVVSEDGKVGEFHVSRLVPFYPRGPFQGGRLEKQDGFMIDNEDIGRDIDLLTDEVRPLHDSPLTTVAKMCLIESIDECKTRGPLHLLRSDS
jgi:hypothetical protein